MGVLRDAVGAHAVTAQERQHSLQHSLLCDFPMFSSLWPLKPGTAGVLGGRARQSCVPQHQVLAPHAGWLVSVAGLATMANA